MPGPEASRTERAITPPMPGLLGPFESEESYSHIGGYPSFVQNDPRDEFEGSCAATVNLLTIEVRWGGAARRARVRDVG